MNSYFQEKDRDAVVAVHGAADRRRLARRGRDASSRSPPQTWDHRADPLSVETNVWNQHAGPDEQTQGDQPQLLGHPGPQTSRRRRSKRRGTYAHDAEGFAFVIAGDVTLTVEGEVYRLSTGIDVTNPPGSSHHWENTGSTSAQILVVSTRAGI
jgi:mannose-6-phosphate isomerase-like protein (cupin superfamily)